MRRIVILLAVLLPLIDLIWNLTHLNIGLQDFFGLAAFAHGLVENGAWPATPYFPAGYPLLLIPGGLMGNILVWGYLLSAAGCILGLTGLVRLLDVFSIDHKYQSLAIAAAWLMPVWRIPAGSPSVDMLYTGLGIWFIAGAIYLWQHSVGANLVFAPDTDTDGNKGDHKDRPYPRSAGILPASSYPRWVYWAMLAAPALLTFLRYHALVLLVPVLLILLYKYRCKLRILHHALIVVALITAVNHLIPLAINGKPMPSVVPLQIRAGIEFENAIDYETPESIFQDYRNFADETRSMSVVEHYCLPLVASHTLKGWLKFLRRPAIALGLLLVIAALVFRRLLPAGIGILALWLPLYCLALSPAYYTPRATTLPALVAIAICFVIALQFVERRSHTLASVLLLVLLISGYAVSSKYCWLIWQERSNYYRLSEFINRHLGAGSGLDVHEGFSQSIVTNDDRVFRISYNPWCTPFASTNGSWLLDPAINSTQIPDLTYYNPNKGEFNDIEAYSIEAAVLVQNSSLSKCTQWLYASGSWHPAWTPKTETDPQVWVIHLPH